MQSVEYITMPIEQQIEIRNHIYLYNIISYYNQRILLINRNVDNYVL